MDGRRECEHKKKSALDVKTALNQRTGRGTPTPQMNELGPCPRLKAMSSIGVGIIVAGGKELGSLLFVFFLNL